MSLGCGYMGAVFPGLRGAIAQPYIRQVKKGDVVAIPEGTIYWWYNNGNEVHRVLCAVDTSVGVHPGRAHVRNNILASLLIFKIVLHLSMKYALVFGSKKFLVFVVSSMIGLIYVKSFSVSMIWLLGQILLCFLIWLRSNPFCVCFTMFLFFLSHVNSLLMCLKFFCVS